MSVVSAAHVASAAVSVSVEALPNGDALVDEMIAASGRRATAALKRATKSKGSKVEYTPRGWTFGGQVD